MDDNYKTPLIVEAVRMAARNVTFADDAIFHSDRGSNYTLQQLLCGPHRTRGPTVGRPDRDMLR